MKTNTFLQKNKTVVRGMCSIVLLLFVSTVALSQVQNNGSIYVANNGIFYVRSGNYAFGTGGATQTTRTVSTYGRLIFEGSVTTSGAVNAHSANGYVGRRVATASFPVGDTGVYAPIQLSSVSNVTNYTYAAYRALSAATVGATLDATVASVSSLEYWNVIGTGTANVRLTWRTTSNLTGLGVSTSLDNLTIVGYDGTRWVAIPSNFDVSAFPSGSSTISAGSITSTNAVDLSTYRFFSLGTENNPCAPIVGSSGNTKTWNGSIWSPSAPTEVDPVVINAAYTAGSFACNSLVLNANITLTNGQNVDIVNGVTGPGAIVMSSEASVVQRLTIATAPNIQLTKRTRVLRQFDYVYWGSPIASFSLANLATAQAAGATLADAFDSKIKYVSLAGTSGGWKPLDAISVGGGFATRIKSQAPYDVSTYTGTIDLVFNGVANNGDVTVNITRDGALPNSARSNNLVANPYPSAIDADKFLVANTSIDGAVYIWSATTQNAGVNQNYSVGDYMVYTRAGVVAANSVTKSFNGKIASGQGFKVRSLVNSGTITFTNCMRLTADNNQFQKVKDTKAVTSDSYKLNMTNDNGIFSQILVAYMPEATLGYDRMYDAGRSSVSAAQLFSIFEGDGQRLAINARPSFVADDSVALGVSKTGTNEESFTISITEKKGVFNTAEQSVYIHDAVNNTYHDLNNGDFSFTTDKNVLDRYKVVYAARTLSNPKFEDNGVIASLNNNVIKLHSKLPLTGIEVFDLTGRKILDSEIDNTLTSSTSFLFPKAVYIVKAKLNDGSVASFKLIESSN